MKWTLNKISMNQVWSISTEKCLALSSYWFLSTFNVMHVVVVWSQQESNVFFHSYSYWGIFIHSLATIILILFAGVFALLNAVSFSKYIQNFLTKSEFRYFSFAAVTAAAAFVFVAVVGLTWAGNWSLYNMLYYYSIFFKLRK